MQPQAKYVILVKVLSFGVRKMNFCPFLPQKGPKKLGLMENCSHHNYENASHIHSKLVTVVNHTGT